MGLGRWHQRDELSPGDTGLWDLEGGGDAGGLPRPQVPTSSPHSPQGQPATPQLHTQLHLFPTNHFFAFLITTRLQLLKHKKAPGLYSAAAMVPTNCRAFASPAAPAPRLPTPQERLRLSLPGFSTPSHNLKIPGYLYQEHPWVQIPRDICTRSIHGYKYPGIFAPGASPLRADFPTEFFTFWGWKKIETKPREARAVSQCRSSSRYLRAGLCSSARPGSHPKSQHNKQAVH